MAESPRDRYTLVDGVWIHWLEEGQPYGPHPPIVLLHGMADSCLTWSSVTADLARDRLVLRPDLPGCGLSGRPDASYKLDWHARIIAQWLQQRGLSSVDVVGHSFGGGVAQMLLLACPERIRRLVLVASGGLGREVGFWLKFATFPYFVERYGQPFMAFGTRRALSKRRAKKGREGNVQNAPAGGHIEALAKMNARGGTARAFSRTVRDVVNFRGQTRHFLHRAHEAKRLPPIAVLWGEHDTLIPSTHGRALADKLDGVVFEAFPNAGHYVHQDCPEDFVRVVRAFLDAKTAAPVTLRAEPPMPAKRGRRKLPALLKVIRDRA